MERHNSNAMELANWLSEYPKIDSVFYPGLETNSGYTTAVDQMKGFFWGSEFFTFWRKRLNS